MTGSGNPPREPDAVCDGCGARGTVGRATRTDAEGTSIETHVFCAQCWPERSAQLEARWGEESRVATEAWMRAPETVPQPPARGAAFESATWHGVLTFVREIHRALRSTQPPSTEDLAHLAEELRNIAPDREGPMPLEIEVFIQTYGAPAG